MLPIFAVCVCPYLSTPQKIKNLVCSLFSAADKLNKILDIFKFFTIFTKNRLISEGVSICFKFKLFEFATFCNAYTKSQRRHC